ncbi:hypothetical protein BH09BAC5_BH09BAC5_06830 [soil metagenome]
MEARKPKTVGEHVAEDYRTSAVFQKYGINFCCKGNQTIAEACIASQISMDELLAVLDEVKKQPVNQNIDYKSWELSSLIEHIETQHHHYIKETTAVLKQYLDELCKVCGNDHPELLEITKEFNASSDELAILMRREELIIFPFIRMLAAKAKMNQHNADNKLFGTIDKPFQMIIKEHIVEGERFMKIASITHNYTPFIDKCAACKDVFLRLKEFEDNLHLHVHLENNILFPQAVELDKKLHEGKKKREKDVKADEKDKTIYSTLRKLNSPEKRNKTLQVIAKLSKELILYYYLIGRFRAGMKKSIAPLHFSRHAIYLSVTDLAHHLNGEDKILSDRFPVNNLQKVNKNTACKIE